MRDLKFRVWNPNANEFVGYAGVKDMPLHEAGALVLNIPVYEILQYTGLKDKNGVEIYEGDILDHTWDGTDDIHIGHTIDKVYWDNECAMFKFADHSLYLEEVIPEAVVVGNIYENKDLLK